MADRPEIQADSVSKTACGECGAIIDVSGQVPLSVMQCPNCQTKFVVPCQIGQFLLMKCLGKGGMGATYKGIDRVLRRNVAVKVMQRSLGDDARGTERFFNEARALAALNHPNIAHIYSLGTERGQPYLVMEFLGGGPMDKQFTRERPMNEMQVIDIAIDVAEALKATSEISMVHGDVKPANILLDNEGVPKLVDFGIAQYGAARESGGAAMGTPNYIAPEQARRQQVDFRADIYSLGATLFHALAGRAPFEGSTVEEVVAARLRPPVPDLRQYRPDLCDKTVQIVWRMMQIDPNDRYQSYYDLLGDLSAAHKQAGQEALGRYMAARNPPAAGEGESVNRGVDQVKGAAQPKKQKP
jgi:serine/threonine protein kinase